MLDVGQVTKLQCSKMAVQLQVNAFGNRTDSQPFLRDMNGLQKVVWDEHGSKELHECLDLHGLSSCTLNRA